MRQAATRLPELDGSAIRVEFLPDLRVTRRKLHSGGSAGEAVHAASFLLLRRIVLDSSLLCYPAELRRILIHELFHFVWWRLGNPRRSSWEDLLLLELHSRARGELGWSAEMRKRAMEPDDIRLRSWRWRDYVCESFCDTAAWMWGQRHEEHTLAARFCTRRKLWMQGIVNGPLSI